MQDAALAALREWPRTGPAAAARLADAGRAAQGDRHPAPGGRPGGEGAGRGRPDGAAGKRPAAGQRGARRPASAHLHLLPPRAGAGLPGGAGPAHAVRAVHRADRRGAAATEPAMAKRLTRTRQKISASRIPYRVPADAELPARLAAVCAVVHALYTSGHAPLGGPALVDVDVCAEAVRLARLLHELLPDEAMPAAVLALLLLTEARRPARVDPAGEVGPARRPGPHPVGHRSDRRGLRAAGRVVAAYRRRRRPVPAAGRDRRRARPGRQLRRYRLDRDRPALRPAAGRGAESGGGVEPGGRDGRGAGADAGLDALRTVPPSPRWHAVRGELLARTGRYREAAAAASEALTGELTDPERRHQERRRGGGERRQAGGAQGARTGPPDPEPPLRPATVGPTKHRGHWFERGRTAAKRAPGTLTSPRPRPGAVSPRLAARSRGQDRRTAVHSAASSPQRTSSTKSPLTQA